MQRVRLWAVFAFALLFVGTIQSAFAGTVSITSLFSTGVDGSGTPLAPGLVDPHYTVGGNAFAINPSLHGWVGNTATSSWISNDASSFGGPGPFTYQTTFDLTGLSASTAQIGGLLSADDQATIYLNGNLVFTGDQDSTSPWSRLEAFSITSGFIGGINTLDIVVPNNIETANDGPTGLQLDISGTASTPEPASLALVGLGLGALKLFRRKA